jgi:hypothetical protein
MRKLFTFIIVLSGMLPVRGQDISEKEVYELFLVQALRKDNIVNNNVAAMNEPSAWSLINGNYVMQIQFGNRNHSLIGQVAGTGNIVKVLQQGHINWIGCEQAGKGRLGICQSGNSNYAEIEQFGNQNKSKAFQYGNNNEINIAQHGGTGLLNDYGDFVNKSRVTQTGDGNSATVIQTGDRNSATVIQTF